MSVSDGQRVNAAVTNAAFVSRTADDNTVGVKALENANPVSGGSITNAQREHNSVASFVGKGTNSVFNDVPTWVSDSIGTPNDPVKNRVDAVQGALETAQSDISSNTADISDIRTLTGTVDGDTDLGTFIGTTISDNTTVKNALQELETEVELKIDLAEKGAANGVATLDGSGRIPSSQLSISVMEFKGNWDASTNSPTLANGVGDTGDIYKVTGAGSVDFGAGSIAFSVGDWVYYDGSVWGKDADAVNSVNGQDGDVVLDTDDIGEGTTNLYFTDARADARIAAASIDDLADVDTTTVPPVLDDVLTWDGSQWAPAAPTTGGGSSGQGAKNYVPIGSSLFEVDVDIDWFTFDDSSAYVDGTGGTALNITIAQTGNVGEVLEGVGSFRIAKAAANAQYEGTSVDLTTIDRQDLGRTLYGQIEVDCTDANYSSGDLKLFAFDVTNSAILPLINDDDGEIPSGKGKVLFRVLPTTTTEQIRLSIMVNSTNALAYEVFVDDVRLGPAAQIEAPIITPWRSYVPEWYGTTTNPVKASSPTNDLAYWRRVGNNLEIIYNYRHSVATGASNGSGDIGFSLPPEASNLTFAGTIGDASNMGRNTISMTSTNAYVGVAAIRTISGAPRIWGTSLAQSGATAAPTGNLTATSFTFTSAVARFSAYITLPVNEWSASAILSTTEAANQTIKMRYSTNAGQSIANNDSSQTIVFEDETYNLSGSGLYNTSTGVFTSRIPMHYRVSASINFGLTTGWGDGESAELRLYKNGSLYSILSRTTRHLQGSNQIVESGSGSDTIFLDANDTFELRAFQNSGAALALFNNGSYNWLNVESIPDFTTFGVTGNYEEYSVESSAFSISTAGYATNEWAQMTGNSLTLPPGVWDVQASGRFNGSASVSWTLGEVVIALANGDNTTTLPTAITPVRTSSTQSFSRVTLSSSAVAILAVTPANTLTLNTSTTIFAVPRVTFATADTATVVVNIRAVRLR